jgi:hypothetical protein
VSALTSRSSVRTMALVAVSLGACTSVAVAWGLAWTAPTPGTTIGFGKRRVLEAKPDPFPLKWYVFVERGRGVVHKMFLVDTGDWLTTDEEHRFMQLASDVASRRALARHAFLLGGRDAIWVQFDVKHFGWPVPCLALEDAFTQRDSQLRRMVGSGSSFDLEESHTPDMSNMLRSDYGALAVRDRLLPLRPLWGALALCSALYALLWFLLLILGRSLVCRRRPGCCAGCGYELSGLPSGTVCPECGHSSHGLIRDSSR